MLTRVDLRGRDLAADPGPLAEALAPPAPEAGEGELAAVREVIASVREGGDEALRALTARFDGCDVDDLRVPQERCDAALAGLEPAFRDALTFARDQIEAYHRTQLDPQGEVHTRSGISVRELVRPVDRAGCYVPGGRATYPSTVLMTAVPARVAGVGEVALCVPPGPDGWPPDATLAAAALAGVDEVYRVGGAQAIAALAYGTETIHPVDVIVGPGNVYVALAKREVSGVVGIESLAGPSELVVVADDETPAAWAAIDLVAQAEHGPGGKAVLVTWSEAAADAIDERVAALTAESPRREEVESTMKSGGMAVLVDDPKAAMAVSNWVAPEHLQLMCAGAEGLVEEVRCAGAVFVGPWAPAPVGDYVAGVNHVLPTARTARFSSALRVDDFLKRIHVVSLDADALAGVEPTVSSFAEIEGLDAHGRSVRMRIAPPEEGRE
ncbi:MAG: histidinol dehydrogenase [Actinobacteria bacterium]|nr:histidinol dehydrogenase [Actinomycetota bacterium]